MRTPDWSVGSGKSVLCSLILWGALWSSRPALATVACGDSFPTCNGSCPPDQACSVSGQACVCEPLGCCEFNANTECFNTTQTDCESNALTVFVPDELCVGGLSCVPKPSSTPTVTPTPLPCGGTVPACEGSCPTGQRCSASGQACVCEPLGCCKFNADLECFTTTQTDCDSNALTDFVPGQVCVMGSICVTGTPTATPTITPVGTPTNTPTTTPTATPTRVPNGGS